ncbi:MAG: response regulator [Deltaproteobacteria bacterium]|nr:response regulator [Deltaproteobacteria bacterium]
MTTADRATILIADDDRDFVKILRELLIHSGYNVIEAYEGVRAIEYAHARHPDLILLDIRMPVGTGEMVLERLRADGDTHGIPIFVMTGFDDGDLPEKLHQAGADAFFKKPIDNNHLVAEIAKVVM